jgi:hypothetical protein
MPYRTSRKRPRGNTATGVIPTPDLTLHRARLSADRFHSHSRHHSLCRLLGFVSGIRCFFHCRSGGTKSVYVSHKFVYGQSYLVLASCVGAVVHLTADAAYSSFHGSQTMLIADVPGQVAPAVSGNKSQGQEPHLERMVSTYLPVNSPPQMLHHSTGYRNAFPPSPGPGLRIDASSLHRALVTCVSKHSSGRLRLFICAARSIKFEGRCVALKSTALVVDNGL